MARNKDFAVSVNEDEGTGVENVCVASAVVVGYTASPTLTLTTEGVTDQYHGRGGSYVVDEATQTRQPGK